MMMQKTQRAKAGFTLVEIMIVVAIIGLLAAIAIPNFLKARGRSARSACINNLRQIDDAKSEWALVNGKKTGDVPTDADLFGTTNYVRAKPVCPLNGTYTLHPVGTPAACDQPGHVLN